MKVILVDMDDVLADFEAGFLKEWILRYPKRAYVPLEDRIIFDLNKQYIAEFDGDINKIKCSKGFISSLPPKPGAIGAVKEMLSKSNEVLICTSPMPKSNYCVQEKYEWVEHHLDYEWKKRLIITKDKTLVYGDYLIDDNPQIKGLRKPSWEHILYDMPYNRNVTDKRRLTWDNWEDVLKL